MRDNLSRDRLEEVTKDVSDRDSSDGLVVSLIINDENAVNASGGQNSNSATKSILREDGNGRNANIDLLLTNGSEELENRGGKGSEGGILNEETQILSGGDSNEFTMITSDSDSRKSSSIHQAKSLDDTMSLRNRLDGLGADLARLDGSGRQVLQSLQMLVQERNESRLRDDVDELTLLRQDGDAMKATRQQFNDVVEGGALLQGRKFVASREVRDSNSFSRRGLKHVHTMEDDVLKSIVVHHLLLVVHITNKRYQITNIQKSNVCVAQFIIDGSGLNLVVDKSLKNKENAVKVSREVKKIGGQFSFLPTFQPRAQEKKLNERKLPIKS